MKTTHYIVFASCAVGSAICLLLALSNHLPFDSVIAAFATNGLLALASFDFSSRNVVRVSAFEQNAQKA